MKKKAALLFALILAFCLGLTACGESTQNVTVTVANRTLQPIGSVCISVGDDFGENRIDTVLSDGDLLTLDLGEFSEDQLNHGFLISAADLDGNIIYETEDSSRLFGVQDGCCIVFLPPELSTVLDICEQYSGSVYDEMIRSELMDEPVRTLDELSAFEGLWKYDAEPFYLLIGGEAEWMAINAYGEQIGPFCLDQTEDGVVLNFDDGSILTTLCLADDGTLTDGDGNTLRASEALMLLPTPEDPLTQTISFPGSFSNVQVSFPVQMEGSPSSKMESGLSFSAVMEDGTDDYFSNITVSFQSATGFEPYMTQGLATAKPKMEILLTQLLDSMFKNYLIKVNGTDCKDCGSYYSITGYVWLDGSIFAGADAGTPVRGTMEVRYYGSSSHVLVGTAIALENRIQNYYDICRNMLDTVSCVGGWSTAPKTVPAKPAKYSDSGDYGDTFYWYDEDGDVWYWNGSEDIFIGFGDDYYIDDDGQYYESNDAGWDDDDYYDDYDFEYDYYDEYDDYDWSDAGDYYDDGWGDYFG